MPKRRRVGNLLALAVLSAVAQRPMHPYEMASVLRAHGKDQDMPIKWGSLYTVVQNLDKHGLLESTGSTRQGGRPERTTYRITAAGREELRDWVRELVGTPEQEPMRFQAGLSVLSVLPPDEAAELLQHRLDLLERHLDERRATLAGHARQVPRLFLVEGEYELAILAAEATWTRSMVEELTSGSMPGLEQWRTWHRTGELPPELTDLATRGGTDPGK